MALPYFLGTEKWGREFGKDIYTLGKRSQANSLLLQWPKGTANHKYAAAIYHQSSPPTSGTTSSFLHKILRKNGQTTPKITLTISTCAIPPFPSRTP